MKRETDFATMQRLLRGYGITGASLASALGIAPSTARKKLNAPELLTLGDLAKISRRFGIPAESIRENAKK